MLSEDPLWYKDAIIYEVHVRAFQDSDGDGMGDFRGLTQRLDYLQDLGITAIWLLPFYPSPLKDDGYDIADYRNVHNHYGTLHDVEQFIAEAHRRGIRVITELVINHTSDQHPWFQRARKAPAGSSERDFYVWSDAPSPGESPDQFHEARVIFKDFERSNWAWDPVAKSYYWHRFYSHQPDLNYDNPDVPRALMPIVDFWLGMGVDGMRLDAVPYLFEREGTNCENLPETYAFLKNLRNHVDERFSRRMLLAEANQWPEDAARYFGDGQGCHMAFHFPLMPRMFMAIQMEDRFPILDILAQTPEIPESCQWALFLRNHDELTLEMVTDEERDYMNRVYARNSRARINLGIRRRLAPLMSNNRRRIELMNALLLSLPGTPVVYYGDEIGMGDNIYLGDRDGVRTPMQWAPDRNAGFSRANPQSLYLPIIIDPEYHYETINVESHQSNPHSLLNWMKRIIALRKRYKAFGRGSIEFLQPENHRVLAFLRCYENECILVVANLSRYVQFVELDLAGYETFVPIELFGRARFPAITNGPYLLTLGPHSFYWFALTKDGADPHGPMPPEQSLAVIETDEPWERLSSHKDRSALESALFSYLARTRFQPPRNRLRFIEIQECVQIGEGESGGLILLVRTEFFEGEPEVHQVMVSFDAEEVAPPTSAVKDARIARIEGNQAGWLLEAHAESHFATRLLQAVASEETFSGESGDIHATRTSAFEELRGPESTELKARPFDVGQSNRSIVLSDRLLLKSFARVEEGINPDLEIGRFLTEHSGFDAMPRVAGALEYRRGRSEPTTLAILETYIPNRGTAWELTLAALGRFFASVTGHVQNRDVSVPRGSLLEISKLDIPEQTESVLNEFLGRARRIADRTAELHLTLASDLESPDFSPEAFTSLYQRSMYQSMRGRAGRVLRSLEHPSQPLPPGIQPLVQQCLERRSDIFSRYQEVLGARLSAQRIRCHGDYHLGQLLDTGDDFVLIDFEGEAFRFLSERRLKHCPLRDVVSMILSFQYASLVAVTGSGEAPEAMPLEQRPLFEPWSRFWWTWVSAAFLRRYLERTSGAAFMPRSDPELAMLLDVFLLEKSIDSLGFELDHRPEMAQIPILAILRHFER